MANPSQLAIITRQVIGASPVSDDTVRYTDELRDWFDAHLKQPPAPALKDVVKDTTKDAAKDAATAPVKEAPAAKP